MSINEIFAVKTVDLSFSCVLNLYHIERRSDMKRHFHEKVTSFVHDVLVIVDVLVLRGLGGIIIMQTC